jgi:hypothetical protein
LLQVIVSLWTISGRQEQVRDNTITSLSSHTYSDKLTPFSRIVNSSKVLSVSDPLLTSDSILIKWRPVSVLTGVGDWEDRKIIPGGRLLSWLVSFSNKEIMGFIVEGLFLHFSFFPHIPH